MVIHGYINQHKSTPPFSHLYSKHNTHTTYNDNMHSLQRAGQDGSGIRSHKGQIKPSIYFVAHEGLGTTLSCGQMSGKSRKCSNGLSTPNICMSPPQVGYKPSPVPCPSHHSVHACGSEQTRQLNLSTCCDVR